MSAIVAILNQKGGVGKTTTAINLGAYLAKAGKSVLLVDFDPQGNATSGLGINKHALEQTVYSAMLGSTTADKAIVESPVAGLNVMTANADLAGLEIELVDQPQRETKLQKLLQGLDYEFILIDCPPALGLLTINALVASDWLLIPVQAEYYALEGLSQLLDVVGKVRGGLNKNLELLGVVVTMHSSRTTLSESVHQELQTFFGDKVFKTVIPRNVKLAEAPSHGRPISDHDKWSKGARAYKQLTKEVISRAG